MRVCFYTLGCKVNLNETEALEQLFRRSGFTVVPDGQPADVYIVNSCTVTNFGDQKSRKWLRHAKRENPGAVTVLTGCYPQAFPEQAAGLLEADLVCGNTDRRAILDHVMQLLNGHERIVAVTPHTRGEAFEEMPVDRFETHTRAFIKVEDGCNRRCAYCIIPKARGPVRSRPISSILAELRQLAGAGYREVVLSAISLPSYGTDTGTDPLRAGGAVRRGGGHPAHPPGQPGPRYAHPGGHPPAGRRGQALSPVPPQPPERLRRHAAPDAPGPTPPAQYLDVVRQLRQAYAGRPVSFPPTASAASPGRARKILCAAAAFWKKWAFCGCTFSPIPGGRAPRPTISPSRSTSGKSRPAAAGCTTGPRRSAAPCWPAWKAPRTRCCWETPVSATVFTGYTRLYVPVSVSAPGCAAGDIVRVRLGRYDGARVQAAFLGRV